MARSTAGGHSEGDSESKRSKRVETGKEAKFLLE
jgi:hypothetical protein